MKKGLFVTAMAIAVLCLGCLLSPAVSEAAGDTNTYTYTFTINGADANFWSNPYLTSRGIANLKKITLRIVSADDTKIYAQKELAAASPVSPCTVTGEAPANTSLKAKMIYDYSNGVSDERYGPAASTNLSAAVSIQVTAATQTPKYTSKVYANNPIPAMDVIMPGNIWSSVLRSGDKVGRLKRISAVVADKRSGTTIGSRTITYGTTLLATFTDAYDAFFMRYPKGSLDAWVYCECDNMADNQRFIIALDPIKLFNKDFAYGTITLQPDPGGPKLIQ